MELHLLHTIFKEVHTLCTSVSFLLQLISYDMRTQKHTSFSNWNLIVIILLVWISSCRCISHVRYELAAFWTYFATPSGQFHPTVWKSVALTSVSSTVNKCCFFTILLAMITFIVSHCTRSKGND